VQSTKKENEFTKQEILEIFQDVRKEHGKITQRLVTKNSSLKRQKNTGLFRNVYRSKIRIKYSN